MASEKSLSGSLRYIYERFGVDVFLNEKTMYSLLSDLIPKEKMEINWVIDAINCGAIKPLVEGQKTKNIESKKVEARKILELNEINESRINYLLNCFFYGLKWTDKIITIEEFKKQSEKNNSNVKKKGQNTNNNKKNINVNQNNKSSNKKVNINPNATNKKGTNTKSSNTNTNNNNTNTNKQTSKNGNIDDKILKINKDNADRLNKLQLNYNALYNRINKELGIIEREVINLKTSKTYLNLFINAFVFVLCIIIVFSFAKLFKEGYMYKRILVLDLLGFVLEFKLLKNTFLNCKKSAIDLYKEKMYKKYINLKNSIDYDRKKINTGSIITIKNFQDAAQTAVEYDKQIMHLKDLWNKSIVYKPYTAYNKIKLISALVLCIFIISGIYESRLLYQGNSVVHQVSRRIATFATEKMYQESYLCVTNETANVRVKADKNSESIAVLNKYAIVTATGKTYDKGGTIWYEVILDYNTPGWISSVVCTKVPKQVTIKEEAANVREGSTLNSDVVEVATFGESYQTTGRAVVTSDRTWYEVYVQGEGGNWISSNVVN